ncbi:MAG TPA: indole-3-glycerol phosphate synthase TrpC, partial [Ktedonobacterales bacterium]|nr:indole-3-glycerol phosphate synthase TrpC [Ktedonobacterales bacterium]
LIAEVKRASPSKGLLAETFDPVARALAYEAGGASAISVLTEPHFFLGCLDHLTAVRERVSLPVLRKDFILDPYQIYESRAAGADALLLICAILDDATLRELLALADSLGMDALVEAHNAEETERAVAAGAKVIGGNSRDLRTFAVDTDIVRHLCPRVPDDRVFVAESGISDALGAARARAWGADAILVGEALMRASDPTAKARELATASGGATNALLGSHRSPFVKICGLMPETLFEEADAMVQSGAEAFGLVFAESRRRVTSADARSIISAITMYAGEDDGPLGVGVFVNEDARTIADVAEHVGLDAIQLSGDETPEDCAAVAELVGLPVIKALRLRDESDLAQLDAYALKGATLLLDAHVPGSYGGSGQTGDWELARRAAQRWPIILSGGLTPENVAEAIAQVGPRGVDVSSGVETDGAKDQEKIRRFAAAARAGSPSPRGARRRERRQAREGRQSRTEPAPERSGEGHGVRSATIETSERI